MTAPNTANIDVMSNIRNVFGHLFDIRDISKSELGLAEKTYRLETDLKYYSLKIYGDAHRSKRAPAIAAIQEYLSGKITSIPRIVLHGTDSSLPGYFILMEHKGGVAASSSISSIKESTFADVATALQVLHSTKPEEIGGQAIDNSVSARDFYNKLLYRMKKADTVLRERNSMFSKYSGQLVSRARDNIHLHNTDVFTTYSHNDLSLDNCIIEADRLSGIVDLDNVDLGDPSFDRHYLLNQLLLSNADPNLVSSGIDMLFPKGINSSTYLSGLFVSQFVALSQVMVIQTRIKQNPQNKAQIVERAKLNLEQFVGKNTYCEMLKDRL